MKDKTCCFTGHREIPIDQLSIVKQRTEEYIRRLIDKGVIYFGVGGALGYDTLVARLLLTLRETEFNHIKVILVYPFHGFTNCWTPAQQATYNELLLKYDNRPVKEHTSSVTGIWLIFLVTVLHIAQDLLAAQHIHYDMRK